MSETVDRGQLPPSPRRTRQWARNKTRAEAGIAKTVTSAPDDNAHLHPPLSTETAALESSNTSVEAIPDIIRPSYTELGREDHKLLLRKREILSKHYIVIPRDFQKHAAAIEATLVFGQEEAGTAVCISPKGMLLTCAHCVAETADELDRNKSHWLVFASGRVVAAKCAAWDDRRDLALLRIVSAQAAPVPAPGNARPSTTSFPNVFVAESQVALDARLVCIGHPGSEDLEAAEAGVKTNYDVLHLSTGSFRGYSPGQDLQDNSEIGALQHDCWTYWGHSGAPLLGRRDGRLVGLHSSWDDQTAMRRGVPLEAIKEFLKEHENLL